MAAFCCKIFFYFEWRDLSKSLGNIKRKFFSFVDGVLVPDRSLGFSPSRPIWFCDGSSRVHSRPIVSSHFGHFLDRIRREKNKVCFGGIENSGK